MSAILSVRDLEKTFGPLVAAHHITLDFPAEQTVGIIGANGAGKTTFINMVTGHLRPSQGSIHFEGLDITGLPSREITRLGISRSFQVAQIFPSLTVHQNICAAAAIARGRDSLLSRVLAPLASPENMAEADGIMALFQIAAYRDVAAVTLPQGVRKLLDIAMAVAGAPRVLLLDEPTSGVSIQEKFAIMDVVMAALASRRITVLFVEHDMEIVARFAARVLAFYDGTVIADGPPALALADPKVQAFISGTKTRAGAAPVGAGVAPVGAGVAPTGSEAIRA
jgi:branched-chain amino acid transport system ATP-binding protein